MKAKYSKYKPYKPPFFAERTWPDKTINQAPIWCSVDLRDGNQSLAIPMNVSEKLDMFQLLTHIGFEHIEIGFPSAAQTEFDFCRTLIDKKHIPEGTSIQVLTQARTHLIERTFEAIKGAERAIVHLYNSTSPLQRKITFRDATKEAIKNIAVEGAKLIKQLNQEQNGTRIQLQYSPESFSDTEPEFALEVCLAVMDIWEPTADNPIILNLPATVEWFTPNLHADQIEWFCKQLESKNIRDTAIISLHTHNDRGTGMAATELGLMAGADRVEGTLFGNGERTGNLDLVNAALNLFTLGVDPELNLDDVPQIRETYERCTRMQVPPRQPYAGDLVFTAFSGSHQDAIKKGLDRRNTKEAKEDAIWEVPYLTIAPEDIGRDYEAIIRINSQSGKGGVAFVLQNEYGIELPQKMQPEVGKVVSHVADTQGKELNSKEIYQIFKKEYLEKDVPLRLIDHEIKTEGNDAVQLRATVCHNAEAYKISGNGNGPINAFVQALESKNWKHFKILDYRSHAIGGGSATQSAAYIHLLHVKNNQSYWGCGVHTNIERAGLLALVSAYNRSSA